MNHELPCQPDSQENRPDPRVFTDVDAAIDFRHQLEFRVGSYREAIAYGESVDLANLHCLDKIIAWIPQLHGNFFAREQEVNEGHLRAIEEYKNKP